MDIGTTIANGFRGTFAIRTEEIKKAKEEVDKTYYADIDAQKVLSAVQSKIRDLEKKLKELKKGLTISKKASQLWVSSDYIDKERLQYLIYPNGMLYNKENNTVRTPRVNSIFTVISCLSYISAKNKNGQPS